MTTSLERAFSPPRREPGRALTAARRGLLALVAFAGTAAYAASFALNSDSPTRRVAMAVGIAAAVSWPVFGLALLAVGGGWRTVTRWCDACLRTMAVGMVVLGVSGAANVVSSSAGLAPPPACFHVAVLLTSNLVMAATFARLSAAIGLRLLPAIVVWFVVLNGTFAAVLLGLYLAGGFVV